MFVNGVDYFVDNCKTLYYTVNILHGKSLIRQYILNINDVRVVIHDRLVVCKSLFTKSFKNIQKWFLAEKVVFSFPDLSLLSKTTL